MREDQDGRHPSDAKEKIPADSVKFRQTAKQMHFGLRTEAGNQEMRPPWMSPSKSERVRWVGAATAGKNS
jgi:hypothetical protein